MKNYLTFIKNVGSDKHGKTVGLYKCICGNEKEINNNNVKRGKTISCGCYKSKLRPTLTHGLSSHPLFRIWNAMNERCTKENNKDYDNYGGRGVRVCDEWRDNFKSFYNWAIENSWQKGLEIDKDIKGDGLLYSPETCTITTHTDNCNSKRNNTYLTFKGETKTYAEWSRQYNLKRTILRYRIKSGWDIEDALTYSVQKHGGSVANNRYKRSIKYSFGYIN